MRIITDGLDTESIPMDLETEKKKKKPRKVVRRKTLRREKTEHVEEITNRVGGLKVEASPVDQSRSQPSSRRGSTLPSALLLNPGELTRRASNAVMTDLPDLGSRRGSQVVEPERRGEVTRRGSVKRGSISWEQEDQMESKKLKAALEAMGMMKKKQKEFLWDSVNSSSSKEESGEVRVGNLSNPAASQMTKDQALKTLGLANTQSKGKFSKPKNVTDYSEQEILTAFQNECKSLSKDNQRFPILI